MRLLDIGTFKEYYRYVTEENRNELTHLFDAISTNLTSFFREPKHFDFLKEQVLPGLIEEKKKRGSIRIRAWSAASSTGEEAYSMAMTISDLLMEPRGWDVKILATDINTQVLKVAREGLYRDVRIQSLPKSVLSAHFLKGEGDKEGYVKVKRDIRDMVVARRLNLTAPRYPFKKEFDFIFCRNVMIYFDKATQRAIIDRLYHHLKKGGYLFLGHAESLTGHESPLVYVKPTIYMKK